MARKAEKPKKQQKNYELNFFLNLYQLFFNDGLVFYNNRKKFLNYNYVCM